MPKDKRVTFSDASVAIVDVADYHNDVVASLRRYLTMSQTDFPERYAGKTKQELLAELQSRLDETDLRSSFAVFSSLESTFRMDYLERAQNKQHKRDELSKAFRELYKRCGANARLEDDIFEVWRTVYPETRQIIGSLRGAFKFRHWLAHGRYWQPKFGQKYDYFTLYAMADAVLESFPFYSQ